MKTRMFQQIVILSLPCIFLCGCQSLPFANRSQSAEELAQDSTQPKKESAMQKNLREAMASERAKGRLERSQRKSRSDSSASLAELSAHAETQTLVSENVKSTALPLSTTQEPRKQSKPTSVQSELNLAYDADRSGHTEKAQGYYQRVLSLDPDNFEALHRLAILEDKKQNYPAAEAYYLKALKVDSTNADLLSDIGYSYMLQGRDDYGEKYLQEALKHQPGHVRSLDHLGWFYGRTGQYDQALAMFRMTSDEAQAQLKFAQLFPGVEPESTLAQRNALPEKAAQQEVQMVPQNHFVSRIQPAEQVQMGANQQIQYVATPDRREPSTPVLNSSGKNPTQQIAEMMQREREKAILARGEVQQRPLINPNQAIHRNQTVARQPVDFPVPVATFQQERQVNVNPQTSPGPAAGASQQIQAWPPVGDPKIAQAVEASNYWALKEQQQNQKQISQPTAPQTYRQQYQNQIPQGRQQVPQLQNQRLPAGVPQQRLPQQQQQRRVQQIPQQRRRANVPQAGQPMYGTQYQNPGQFRDNRINSTQSSLQQAVPNSRNLQQTNDQQQVREAARTGMNLGPSQMFPVVAGGGKNSDGSNLMSAQFPSNNILPASAQVAPQNVYQAGGQSIRQAQVGRPVNQNQSAAGIRQVGYETPQQQPAQTWNSGGYQQGASALPQSAMFSSNPAVAPANVRSIQSNTNPQMPASAPQSRMNVMGNRGSESINQKPNASGSLPIQWGSKPQASPYQFPVQ